MAANIIGDEDIENQKKPAVFVRSPWQKKGISIILEVLAGIGVMVVIATVLVYLMAYDAREATEVSLELAGFEGLTNAMLGHTVSPAFRLNVHVENHRFLQPHSWCYSGGEVVVSYSDVALAWAHVLRFCMKRRVPTELTVVARGKGVGLSEDLHRHLDSERHMGTGAQITVEMKLFLDCRLSTQHRGPQLYEPFKFALKGD